MAPESRPARQPLQQLQDCHAFVAIRRDSPQSDSPKFPGSMAHGTAGAAGTSRIVREPPRRATTPKRRVPPTGRWSAPSRERLWTTRNRLNRHLKFCLLHESRRCGYVDFPGPQGTGMRTEGGQAVPMSKEAGMTGFRGTGREAASGDRRRSLPAGSGSCRPFAAIDNA